VSRRTTTPQAVNAVNAAPKGLTPSILCGPRITLTAYHELAPMDDIDRRIQVELTSDADSVFALKMTQIIYVGGASNEYNLLSVDAFSREDLNAAAGLFDWCRTQLDDIDRARCLLIDAGCAR